MSWWVVYLLIMLITVEIDGYFCYLSTRRFRLRASIVLALVWPISLPLGIYACWKSTQTFPTWDND